jgi:hypothetical protein
MYVAKEEVGGSGRCSLAYFRQWPIRSEALYSRIDGGLAGYVIADHGAVNEERGSECGVSAEGDGVVFHIHEDVTAGLVLGEDAFATVDGECFNLTSLVGGEITARNSCTRTEHRILPSYHGSKTVK